MIPTQQVTIKHEAIEHKFKVFKENLQYCRVIGKVLSLVLGQEN